jgi:hypothetical protein
MNDSRSPEEKKKSRLRWVTLGESIAISALVVSAVGVWISWKGDGSNKATTTVVEKRQSIPLTLRGKAQNGGRSLEISPVETGHALQSLAITLPGADTINLGSDGELGAGDVESALGKSAPDGKGTQRVGARIVAKYVEAGADKSATGSYVINYRWEGGGLFGGRSLRLVSLGR